MHTSLTSMMLRAGAILFFAGLTTARPAAAQTMQGLGFLPGDTESGARAVSADGSTVAGYSRGPGRPQEAVIWTTGTGMVGLGYLPNQASSGATDISANGSTVVGFSPSVISIVDGSSVFRPQAFVWTAETGMVGLGALPGAQGSSAAFGVSADGATIVGQSGSEGFIWRAETGMVGLGFLPGAQDGWSFPRACSADGSTVVGSAKNADGFTEPFVWTAARGMVGLGYGPLGGRSPLTLASDVSADGSAVIGVDGTESGFIWTAATGMTALDGTYAPSFPMGISADGRKVVGNRAGVNGLSEVYVWTAATGIVGLGGIPGQMSTQFPANDISADGNMIVGQASNATGALEAFRFRLRAAINVAIDVLPDSRDNQINLKSRGKVPVAILSNRTFDALRVDPSTVSFGDPRLTKVPPIKSSKQDVDCDGDKDLVLQFDTETLVAAGAIDANSTRVVLVGRTFAGEMIQGSDKVTVKNPKPGKK